MQGKSEDDEWEELDLKLFGWNKKERESQGLKKLNLWSI